MFYYSNLAIHLGKYEDNTQNSSIEIDISLFEMILKFAQILGDDYE
jgi:hypothetical protein